MLNVEGYKRGCGYRKAGGLYCISGKFKKPEDFITDNESQAPASNFLPFPCGEPFSRALKTLDAQQLFQYCSSEKAKAFVGNIGLMWVGEQYYTPLQFIKEAEVHGISKRIARIPEKLAPLSDKSLGSMIALAHPNAFAVKYKTVKLPKSAKRKKAPEIKVPYVPYLEGQKTAGGNDMSEIPVAIALGNYFVALHREDAREKHEGEQAEITADLKKQFKKTPDKITYNIVVKKWEYPEDTLEKLDFLNQKFDGRSYKSYGSHEHVSGVFCVFVYEGVQILLPKQIAENSNVQAVCEAKGLEIVVCPDNDPDHGTASMKLPSWLKEAAQMGELEPEEFDPGDLAKDQKEAQNTPAIPFINDVFGAM